MNADYRRELQSYLAGLAIAAVLTVAAFGCVVWTDWPRPAVLWVTAALAATQVAVHLRYFLHLTWRRSNLDRLQLVAFTILLVVLMAGGTLWILGNLRERMM
ncbi:MAG TPA: cytochrome C oxidase subunit IV family protein [Pseudolabrys sp.]|nr:cytochrome C oxidase subunit IV family protein [Pseudolabrys sp.]